MPTISDHSGAGEGASAAKAHQALLCAAAATKGVFNVEHIGPPESRRDEYLVLRDNALMYEERARQMQCDVGRRRAFARAALSLRAQMRGLEEVKSRDTIHNLITTVGKNDQEDKYLAGSAYTATVRMGLKGTGTAVVGDTQASHAGWLELGLANAPAYTGNRPTPSFSAAAAGVKSTSSAVTFSFTTSGTVYGCFINNGGSATKDDTTGILFSVGDFSNGSKAVANGDVLNVTYSYTLT